jgi:hypothetical protein
MTTELKMARSVAFDKSPDDRGNVVVLVRLDDERTTALVVSAN